jgi:Na+-driven multidrug efflux pump
MNIRIIGLPFLYIYQMRNALLVGINQSRLLVLGTAAEAVVNVVFDYGLIFGKVGLPPMGFNGAAVASVLAELAGMVVIFFVIKAKGITRQFSLFAGFAYNKAVTLTILKLSGPLIFQMAISIISWFFFYLLIEHHGQTPLAISNTMRNVFGFFGVFSWAFASTANSMVSNLIGQGKKDAVVPVLFKVMRLSTSVAIVVCLLLNLFPGTYFSAFGQAGNFSKEGIPTLRIVSVAIIILSAGTVWLNGVTGTGNSKMTFIIELAAIIVYSVYVYLVLEVLKLSIAWGWASELIYWTIMFSVSFWYVKSGRWMGRKAI